MLSDAWIMGTFRAFWSIAIRAVRASRSCRGSRVLETGDGIDWEAVSVGPGRDESSPDPGSEEQELPA